MRLTDLTDLGGFLWWLLIRFCKTDLDNEQSKEKWSRNLFFLIILGLIIAFSKLMLFPDH